MEACVFVIEVVEIFCFWLAGLFLDTPRESRKDQDTDILLCILSFPNISSSGQINFSRHALNFE